ncbi:MAG: preprotein translocase subunit YajC [Thermoguttaceae bacterium]
MSLILMIGPILIIFWFFMIRPQQREEDRRRKMISALKKNDKVYTVGGIVGVVHSVDLEKKEVILKVDDSNNTKMRFLLSAVSAVLSDPDSSAN